ncbi:MAG TPA: hypothetical protein PKZ76_15590 [Xanthomonadaceae bacterium]|nr:hypothetical protein [Xanthomonadaceae bacterium]
MQPLAGSTSAPDLAGNSRSAHLQPLADSPVSRILISPGAPMARHRIVVPAMFNPVFIATVNQGI